MKLRHLTPALLLAAGLSSCIIHVDAAGDADLAAALAAWRHPGLRELADDLDHAGWIIQDIDRRGGYWRVEARTGDRRQNADLKVELLSGGGYRIKSLEIDSRSNADVGARKRLRALVDPDSVEVEKIQVDVDPI